MKKILFIIVLMIVTNAYADIPVLDNFLANAKTMKANFNQTVVTGKKSHVSSGTMEIVRPNKFRWEYVEDKQLIISDAKKIYIYDKPLAQVTVKKLDIAIDKSPAAILAGANNIYKLYKISDNGTTADGIHWIKIEPRNVNDNNGFQLTLMGFDKAQKLSSMKFTDAFGNQTILTFSDLKTGINIDNSEFNFKIPAGVDVVDNTK